MFKKKINSLEDYINSCNNKKDMFIFEDPLEAYNFGSKIRENIIKEQIENNVIVDISGNVVRINIVVQELACV